MVKIRSVATCFIITVLASLQVGCGTEDSEQTIAAGDPPVKIDDKGLVNADVPALGVTPYSATLDASHTVEEGQPLAAQLDLPLPFFGGGNELGEPLSRYDRDRYLNAVKSEGFDREQFDLLSLVVSDINSALRHQFIVDVVSERVGTVDAYSEALSPASKLLNIESEDYASGRGNVRSYLLKQDITLPGCDLGMDICNISIDVDLNLLSYGGLQGGPGKHGAGERPDVIYGMMLWGLNLTVNRFEVKNALSVLDLSTQVAGVVTAETLDLSILHDEFDQVSLIGSSFSRMSSHVDGYFTNSFFASKSAESDFRLSATHIGSIAQVDFVGASGKTPSSTVYVDADLNINYSHEILPKGSSLADGIPSMCTPTYTESKHLEAVSVLTCTSDVDTASLYALSGLRTLNITGGESEALDLSGFSDLEAINVLNASLSTLTLPTVSKLNTLSVEGTLLTELDLSTQVELMSLKLIDCPLVSLELPMTLASVDVFVGAKAPGVVESSNVLEWVSIVSSSLMSLDLSSSKILTQLNIDGSQLGHIDLSNNQYLRRLSVSNSLLSSIELNEQAPLGYVNLMGNQLTEINLSQARQAVELNLSGNRIKAIDLSGLNDLRRLDLSSNQLELIDLSANLKLEEVNLDSNHLKNLDFSLNSNLKTLYVSGNEIVEINFKLNSQLNRLYITQGAFPADALAFLGMVEDLSITVLKGATGGEAAITPDLDIDLLFACDLTFFDRKHLDKVLSLTCNGLASTVSFEPFTSLVELVIEGEEAWDVSLLESLDLSKNTALTHLDIDVETTFTELDLSSNIALTHLELTARSAIAVLDLSSNSALTHLTVFKQGLLETLVLPKADTLESITLSQSRELENVSFERSPGLKSLKLLYVSIDELDLSKNINLQGLGIIGSDISELDLSNNLMLEVLVMHENINFSTIDLTSNGALIGLDLEYTIDTPGFVCELCAGWEPGGEWWFVQ